MPRVFFEGPSRPSSGILLAAITWGGAVPGTYTAGYLPRPLRITFTSDSTLGAGDTVTIVPHTQLRAWAICLCEPVGGWVGESGMLLCLCACGGTRVRAANRRASPSWEPRSSPAPSGWVCQCTGQGDSSAAGNHSQPEVLFPTQEVLPGLAKSLSGCNFFPNLPVAPGGGVRKETPGARHCVLPQHSHGGRQRRGPDVLRVLRGWGTQGCFP